MSLIISPSVKKYLGDHQLGPNDAPIFIVLGQSNSYGHGLSTTSLSWANVKMLNKTYLTTTVANVYDANPLIESNINLGASLWTTATNNLSDLNTGVNPTDSTYYAVNTFGINAATEFATLWQANRVTYGLPDLYVVLFGKGSQGMYLDGQQDGWSPDRDATDSNSLYYRCIRTLSLVIENLKAQGKNPRIIGIHWNQWEAEALTDIGENPAGAAPSLHSLMNFQRIVNGITYAVGNPSVDFKFYYPLSVNAVISPSRKADVIKSLDSITNTAANLTYMDIRRYSAYNPASSPLFGVFQSDGVHYLSGVYTFAAQEEFNRVLAGQYGKQGAVVSNILTSPVFVGKIRGDFSTDPSKYRVIFKTNKANAGTGIVLEPNGSGSFAGFVCKNNESETNYSQLLVYHDSGNAQITAGKVGTGVQGSLLLSTSQEALALTPNAYVKLGLNAPAIRQKKLTGTTSSTQGTSATVAHGLSSAKILSCEVLVEFSTGNKVTNSWAAVAGYSFSVTVETSNIAVWNDSGNSGNILSKPFTVLITYEE
jgi:hypothetical protein